MHKMVLSFGLLAVCFAQTVRADSVQVFSTGVDSTGTLLPTGATDAHYTITSGPVGAEAAQVQVLSPLWVSNTSTSQWIIPSPDSVGGASYVYETTFSLAGLNAATAVLTGGFTADNAATIFLNGVNTGFTASAGVSGCACFGPLTPFTITSGFASGLNTLDFVVSNDGDTLTGLQVQISGTANTVPEPSSFLLLGTGLLGLSTRLRRSKKRRIPAR